MGCFGKEQAWRISHQAITCIVLNCGSGKFASLGGYFSIFHGGEIQTNMVRFLLHNKLKILHSNLVDC